MSVGGLESVCAPCGCVWTMVALYGQRTIHGSSANWISWSRDITLTVPSNQSMWLVNKNRVASQTSNSTRVWSHADVRQSGAYEMYAGKTASNPAKISVGVRIVRVRDHAVSDT